MRHSVVASLTLFPLFQSRPERPGSGCGRRTQRRLVGNSTLYQSLSAPSVSATFLTRSTLVIAVLLSLWRCSMGDQFIHITIFSNNNIYRLQNYITSDIKCSDMLLTLQKFNRKFNIIILWTSSSITIISLPFILKKLLKVLLSPHSKFAT